MCVLLLVQLHKKTFMYSPESHIWYISFIINVPLAAPEGDDFTKTQTFQRQQTPSSPRRDRYRVSRTHGARVPNI